MSLNCNYDSYSVLKATLLPITTVSVVDNDKENKPFFGETTKGGILQDSNYVWKANGPHFNLFHAKTGIKIASWNFDVANLSSKVSCVVELQRNTNKLPFLVIGLENGVRGQICVFDFIGSRVLKCIDLDYMVTSICVIDSSCNISSLTEALRAFDGVVVVGTANGNVYLIDICQSECEKVCNNTTATNDEINISEVEVLYPLEINSVDVENYRGCVNKRHLSLHLNAITDNVQHFVLKGPKNSNRLFANKEEVMVSALHYCPQLGSLLVGYNFGAWQLWNLANFDLIYTSPVYEENIPVSHFAVQEPCDDPRAFCYVWVVYSNADSHQRGIPIAVLYSLNYESKSIESGYGILYKNLLTCLARFQITPTMNDDSGLETDDVGTSCLRLQVVNKSVSKNSLNGQDEVITACFIIWNRCSDVRNLGESKTYLNLFDLNQWYKEQMPSALHSNAESFTSCVCLTDILNIHNYCSSTMLDVQIDEESLHQFFGSQKLEEHYYPSSLTFQIMSLSENAVTIIYNKGHQRAMLSSLEALGPRVLLQPSETFSVAINMGLTPLFVDTPTKATSLNDQREFLLATALEQQMLGWLCKCVTMWSSGANDCNLSFLLTWAWQRAQILKENANKLTVSLFDYSGLVLDRNTQNVLNHCLKQLRNLSMLFKFVIKKCLQCVLNPDVVIIQSEHLEIAYIYLEVLYWFQNVGLLPECSSSSYPKTDEFHRIFAPYPVEDLIKYYDKRRTDLNACGMKKFASKESLLFIDNLIEIECGGSHLQKEWENDGGTGIYPPSSLQALMRTYVVEHIEMTFKHYIVTYFLLDLVMALQDDRYRSTRSHLIKFPSVFHLNPSTIKVIQSFWQLDHGNFEEGIGQLLDPMISANDLKIWHHRLVLRTLFAQEEYNLALLYLQARRPAVTDLNDLCAIISLYIANTMIDEAFHFQRQHHNTDISLKLLQHFYRECDKIGNIESVLLLPLWPEEEEAFMKYLTDVNHSQRSYIQILYYTQRSRYVDAMKVNDSTTLIQFQNKGLNGKQMLTDRDRIMNHLQCISNPLSKSIIDELKKIEMNTKNEKIKPTPFSVFVHNSEERVKYKSSLIEAALSKSKEIWSNPIGEKKGTKIRDGCTKNEDIPFLSKLKAVISQPKILSPMIYPKFEHFNFEDHVEPPFKKSKLSSRLSAPYTPKRHLKTTSNKFSVRLNTPIVKRKLNRSSASAVETPQSILKSQFLTPFDLSEVVSTDTPTDTLPQDHLRQRSSLGLTPRRSLVRSSKPEVCFSLSRRKSDSSEVSNASSEQDPTLIEETATLHSPLYGIETSKNVTKKCMSSDSRKRTYDEIATVESTNNLDLPKTPRSRRSYKEVTDGVRSSPRLNKVKELNKDVETASKEGIEDRTEMKNLQKINSEDTSPAGTPRTLRSRRSYKDATDSNSQSNSNLRRTKIFKETKTSLVRDVLENNTFNRMVKNSTSTFTTSYLESVPSNERTEEIVILDKSWSTSSPPENKSQEFEMMEVSEIVENDGLETGEVEVHVSDSVKDNLDNVETDDNLVDVYNKPDNGNEKCHEDLVEVLEVTSTVEADISTEQNDFNIYGDLNAEIYEATDIEMNVLDTPDNEACASDAVSLTSGSFNSPTSGEFFKDKETEQPDSSSQVEVDEQECERTNSSSSDVEVIELSSDSSLDVNNDESGFSIGDGSSSLQNNSCAENSFSEESKNADLSESQTNSSCSSKSNNGNEPISTSEVIIKDEIELFKTSEVDILKSNLITDITEVKSQLENDGCQIEDTYIDVKQIEMKGHFISKRDDLSESTMHTSHEVKISDSIEPSKHDCLLFENEGHLFKEQDVKDSESGSISSLIRTNEDDMFYSKHNDTDESDFLKTPDTPAHVKVTLNSNDTFESLPQTYQSSISKLDVQYDLDDTVDNPMHNDTDDSAILDNLPQINQFDIEENTSIVFEDMFSPQTDKQSTPVTRSKRLSSLQLLDTPETKDIRKFALKRNMSTSDPNVASDSAPSNIIIEDKHRKTLTRRKRSASTTTSIGPVLSFQPNIGNDSEMLEVHEGLPVRRKRSASVNAISNVPVESLRPSTTENSKTSLEHPSVPTRRKRSASANTTTIAPVQSPQPNIVDDSKMSAEDRPVPTRRKRSASTNISELSSSKRELRGRSVDIELLSQKDAIKAGKREGSTVTKRSNVERNSRVKLKESNSASNVEDYSSSRRLTRRQAKMLEKAMGVRGNLTTSEAENENSRDASNLDEELTLKISGSPIGTRLRSRRNSLSDMSATSDLGRQPHNESMASLSITSEESVVNLEGNFEPRKLRKTRQSSKDSDTSIISQTHSLIEVNKPGKITRRTRSMTDETEQPSLRRSKRNLQKSTLPKIVEESNVEGSSKTKQRK